MCFFIVVSVYFFFHVDFFAVIFDIIIILASHDKNIRIPQTRESSANINDEKLFIFELSNMKKEILISETKTVDELISEFKKENKSKKNDLRFFWNNNEI